jgi:proline racemase
MLLSPPSSRPHDSLGRPPIIGGVVRLQRTLEYVDAHAEGEPSRVVIGGLGDVPGTTMLEKRAFLMRERDDLRRLLLREPRGMVSLSADIVLPSSHPEADLGYVIIESTDYPVMSGTNTINTATVILELGLAPMTEPVTRLRLEAPAGIIEIEAQCRDGKCERVTFRNQPAFVARLGVPIEVEGIGGVTVDVAYGGAFFAFVDATALGFAVVPGEAAELARLGELITRAAADQVAVHHPGSPDIPQQVTFTNWWAPPRDGGHWRNANIVSPGRVDRSACGTATCAWMAVQHAAGALEVGRPFISESILGSNFVGRVESLTRVGDIPAVVPSVSGRAWVYGRGQLGCDPDDPFADGYTLSDTWPTESPRSRVGPVDGYDLTA